MKRKSSDRVEAAKNFVSPAVEEISSAADRIGPLVHDAADRVGPLAQSAADRVGPLAQSAADRVGPLAHAAAEKIGPYAHQAVEYVSPYAQQAVDKVSPYAHQAVDRASDLVSPYAHQAAEFVGPYAQSAKKRGAQVAHDAVEKLGPRLDDAWQSVPPAVEAARERFGDDVVPRLSSALSAAAASPVAIEAGKRGRATLAAAKGELVLPEEKKKSRWIKRLAIVAIIGGVAVVAAKKLLGSKDDDWQAARPAATYPTSAHVDTVPVSTAADADAKAKTAEAAPLDEASEQKIVEHVGEPTEAPAEAEPEATVAEEAPVEEPAASEVTTDESVEASSVDETSDEDLDLESGDAPSGDPSRYSGDHVYIGAEPPEGFTIKANERSKKYHTSDSSGYLRTNTEVWFNSEEAAQEAGFVRAQR